MKPMQNLMAFDVIADGRLTNPGGIAIIDEGWGGKR
jgi:hypothetical protein